jgi:hypothetical protein
MAVVLPLVQLMAFPFIIFIPINVLFLENSKEVLVWWKCCFGAI